MNATLGHITGYVCISLLVYKCIFLESVVWKKLNPGLLLNVIDVHWGAVKDSEGFIVILVQKSCNDCSLWYMYVGGLEILTHPGWVVSYTVLRFRMISLSENVTYFVRLSSCCHLRDLFFLMFFLTKRRRQSVRCLVKWKPTWRSADHWRLAISTRSHTFCLYWPLHGKYSNSCWPFRRMS